MTSKLQFGGLLDDEHIVARRLEPWVEQIAGGTSMITDFCC